MQIEKSELLETLGKSKAVIKTYRSNPSNFTAACYAARHYATKFDRDMVVIAGNSYGRAIYHIADPSRQSVSYYNPGFKSARVAIVSKSGEVYTGDAKDA